jgi:hypothetical protein
MLCIYKAEDTYYYCNNNVIINLKEYINDSDVNNKIKLLLLFIIINYPLEFDDFIDKILHEKAEIISLIKSRLKFKSNYDTFDTSDTSDDKTHPDLESTELNITQLLDTYDSYKYEYIKELLKSLDKLHEIKNVYYNKQLSIIFIK